MLSAWAVGIVLALVGPLQAERPTSVSLKVSENRRFLVNKDDGSPFFWLGDTAWELFHRSTRVEAERYLDNRARLGFTVVQAVAIGELDGHSVPNAYGHLPLVDLDPTRPAVKDGPDNDYWDHVDYVVDLANTKGLVVGLLPTWGRYWHDKLKDGRPLFNNVADRVQTSVPGEGRYRFVATRDRDGSYAMVYAPVGRTFRVRMDVIKGGLVNAWWFNPRNGTASRIGTFPNTGERAFAPPDLGEDRDWVLVLDDDAKGYGPPGRAEGK
jgi:hypothetical protein